MQHSRLLRPLIFIFSVFRYDAAIRRMENVNFRTGDVTLEYFTSTNIKNFTRTAKAKK